MVECGRHQLAFFTYSDQPINQQGTHVLRQGPKLYSGQIIGHRPVLLFAFPFSEVGEVVTAVRRKTLGCAFRCCWVVGRATGGAGVAEAELMVGVRSAVAVAAAAVAAAVVVVMGAAELLLALGVVNIDDAGGQDGRGGGGGGGGGGEGGGEGRRGGVSTGGVMIDGLGGGGNRGGGESRGSSGRDLEGGLFQSQGLVAGQELISVVRAGASAAGAGAGTGRGGGGVEAAGSSVVVFVVGVGGSFLGSSGSSGGGASGGQGGRTTGHAAGGVQELGIGGGLGGVRVGAL